MCILGVIAHAQVDDAGQNFLGDWISVWLQSDAVEGSSTFGGAAVVADIPSDGGQARNLEWRIVFVCDHNGWGWGYLIVICCGCSM